MKTCWFEQRSCNPEHNSLIFESILIVWHIFTFKLFPSQYVHSQGSSGFFICTHFTISSSTFFSQVATSQSEVGWLKFGENFFSSSSYFSRSDQGASLSSVFWYILHLTYRTSLWCRLQDLEDKIGTGIIFSNTNNEFIKIWFFYDIDYYKILKDRHYFPDIILNGILGRMQGPDFIFNSAERSYTSSKQTESKNINWCIAVMEGIIHLRAIKHRIT